MKIATAGEGEPDYELSRLPFNLGDRSSLETRLYLLDRTDDQLISGLCLRGVDGMSRQFEDTRRLSSERCDSEPREMLDYVNDPVLTIKIYEIKWEENAQCMHALRGNNPQPFVQLQLQLSNKTF